MASVDKGYFRVEADKQILIYNYSIIRMVLILLAISLVFTLVSQKPIVGVVIACWSIGMNGVITLIRHHLFMRKLVKRIIPEHNTTLNVMAPLRGLQI